MAAGNPVIVNEFVVDVPVQVPPPFTNKETCEPVSRYFNVHVAGPDVPVTVAVNVPVCVAPPERDTPLTKTPVALIVPLP